jgi:uridine kinase
LKKSLRDKMTIEIFVDLVVKLGLPVAILVVLAWYHARVIQAKDKQLEDLNKAYTASLQTIGNQRVAEAKSYMDYSREREKQFLVVIDELNKTLNTMEK